jgi:hypothetical protein
MALTIDVKSRFRIPQGRDGKWEGEGDIIALCTITFDSSYPTGGEPIAVADVDAGAIAAGAALRTVIPSGSADQLGAGGYMPAWDETNGTIMMYEAGADAAPLDEVADTTDLSAEVIQAVIQYSQG